MKGGVEERDKKKACRFVGDIKERKSVCVCVCVWMKEKGNVV